MRGRTLLCVVVAVTLSAARAEAQAYDPDNFDIYKYSQPEVNKVAIPDVDKPVMGDPNDMSCWMACAANILGASGYGVGVAVLNPTPQQRAVHIYNQLRNDLGFTNRGYCEQAVNYWLYTYGKNPDNNTGDYLPTNPYTDVTAQRRALNLTNPGIRNDYDFLLGELARCQYVTVSFSNPEHCITLVGGNYWGNPNNRPDGNRSIWHDSDRDMPDTVVSGDDDVYINAADTSQNWILSDYVTTYANGYVTLCPGLNKPQYAVDYYDVAYYRIDDNQDGVWEPDFRVHGQMGANYAGPKWLPDNNIVEIGNEEISGWEKDVWLLVDYIDQVPGRQADIKLRVMNDEGTLEDLDPTSVTPSEDNGQLLFHWDLDFQPGWEQLVFPNEEYRYLYDPSGQGPRSDVKDWNVATYCAEIPEPTSLTLMTLALAGAAWMRRRQRV